MAVQVRDDTIVAQRRGGATVAELAAAHDMSVGPALERGGPGRFGSWSGVLEAARSQRL